MMQDGKGEDIAGVVRYTPPMAGHSPTEIDRAVSARKVIRDYLLENAAGDADDVRAMLGGYGEEAHDREEVGRIMEAEKEAFLVEFMRRAMSKEDRGGVSSALTRSVRELPPDKAQALFDKLDIIGSDVCKAFRRSLFAFEDAASLDDVTVQRLLHDVDTMIIGYALLDASDAVKEKFLRNMTRRASEYLLEDMQFMQKENKAKIREAQNSIVDAVLALKA